MDISRDSCLMLLLVRERECLVIEELYMVAPLGIWPVSFRFSLCPLNFDSSTSSEVMMLKAPQPLEGNNAR